jgi:hypothetical protein
VYGFDAVTIGWELSGAVVPAELMEGMRLVGSAMQSAPAEVIADELVRLRLMTKSGVIPAGYAEAMLTILTEEIAGYPEDIIVDACRRWARRETFWPSLAELRAELDRVANRRRLLRDALRRGGRNA